MPKSIKINFIYNILLNISKVIFPLITAPYISRVLEPDGIGIYNFTYTYASYFALVAVLGIPNYGIREIAKRRDNLKECERFISQMIGIETITSIIVTIFYLASIFFIGQLNENAILYLISGIVLYLTPFKVEWFFSGLEEFKYITIRSLTIKTLSFILLFVFVRTKGDLINYIILTAIASSANEIWNFIKVYRLGIRPGITFNGIREHIKPVMILFASSVATSIYAMLDTLMLGFMSTYTEVGYYNSAMHLIKALLPIATSLAAVAMPRVAILGKENDIQNVNNLINKSAGVVSFMAFPMSVGIIMIAREFVPLFFGSQFFGSIVPMQIGALLIIFIGLNNLNGVQVLISLGKDKLFLASVSLGALSNFILNMVLIPRYGCVGATIASIYAEFQILVTNEIFVRKYTDVRMSNWQDILKSVSGSVIFIPICLFIGQYADGLLYISLSIVICSLVYIISQKLLYNRAYNLFEDFFIGKMIKHK